jgi:hypothetical protein
LWASNVLLLICPGDAQAAQNRRDAKLLGMTVEADKPAKARLCKREQITHWIAGAEIVPLRGVTRAHWQSQGHIRQRRVSGGGCSVFVASAGSV